MVRRIVFSFPESGGQQKTAREKVLNENEYIKNWYNKMKLTYK